MFIRTHAYAGGGCLLQNISNLNNYNYLKTQIEI